MLLKAFEWLGHWYQGVGGDRERARGCFLRAVKLVPEMKGAGEALALLYLENGQVCLLAFYGTALLCTRYSTVQGIY